MERRKRTQSAPRLRHLERDIIIGIEGNWRKARQYGETEQYSVRKRVFLIKREPRKVFPPKYNVYTVSQAYFALQKTLHQNF